VVRLQEGEGDGLYACGPSNRLGTCPDLAWVFLLARLHVMSMEVEEKNHRGRQSQRPFVHCHRVCTCDVIVRANADSSARPDVGETACFFDLQVTANGWGGISYCAGIQQRSATRLPVEDPVILNFILLLCPKHSILSGTVLAYHDPHPSDGACHRMEGGEGVRGRVVLR